MLKITNAECFRSLWAFWAFFREKTDQRSLVNDQNKQWRIKIDDNFCLRPSEIRSCKSYERVIWSSTVSDTWFSNVLENRPAFYLQERKSCFWYKTFLKISANSCTKTRLRYLYGTFTVLFCNFENMGKIAWNTEKTDLNII